MKKTNFKLIGFFLLLFLITQSCRNESLALEQENPPKYNYNIAVLNKEQFEIKTPLSQEIDKLKTNFFRQTIGKTSTPQDPILEGAIIETNRVLEITDGENNKTYTFPVSRIFPNDIVENLVLRENADHTYSGILIQYNLSKQEKDQYFSGAHVNLNGKIKTFTINNISLMGKGSTYSYYEGCWEYVYESNPCAGSEHHSYGDNSCPLIGGSDAAQPNELIAAYNHCGEEDSGVGDTGGDSGSGSNGGWSGSGSGGTGTIGGISSGGGGGTYNPTTNPYNTFLFASFDDMLDMCPTDDSECQADMLLGKEVQQYLLSLNMKASQLASYSPIWFAIKEYFKLHGGDEALTQRLNLVGNWFSLQNNTNPDVKLNNFKFSYWALTYLFDNQEAFDYFKNHPDDFDILYMDDLADSADKDFATTSADVITDILIAEQSGTFNSFNSSWPHLDKLKQKIKQAISYGVYTTAKYVRNYLVVPATKYAGNNSEKIGKFNNYVIDPIRTEAVTPLVNFDPDTMNWRDLFNIWLFELTPGNFTNNNINFTGISNVVSGNNIYNPSTNAVKNFPKGNGTKVLNMSIELANGLPQWGIKSGYFTYDVNAFYSTLSNANLGIQMLGSFPIKGYVLSKSTHSATVQFTILNNLGWESATRFIKGSNGNIGVFDDKPVGSGLHLGGTISNVFTWTDIVNF